MMRERLLFGIVPSACYQRWNVERAIDPLDTGRKLDAHKTLRIRPGLPLNVLCTSNSRPVYRRRNKLPSKLFTVIFQCYTCKHNREYKLTVAYYVSNIRAFILAYLYKVRVFRAQVFYKQHRPTVACSTLKKYQSFTNFDGSFRHLHATTM